MLERLHTWMGGALVGLVFGLLIGFIIVGDKLPPNESYVEQLDKKMQQRLGLPQ